MIVAPPKRRNRPKPYALLSPGWRALTVETVAGTDTYRGAGPCFEALERLEGHALYTVSSPAQMRHTTGARVWSANAWRGRVTAVRLDGTRVVVRSLRGALEGSSDPFGDLECALGWFGAHGVNPSSLSAMSWSLWRTSLPREVRIGATPRIGRGALYGGRQGVRDAGRKWSHMVAADLVAAYPHSMACRPYAIGLRRVSSDTMLDPSVNGIVVGTVAVPSDMPFGPVPTRIAKDMIQFPRGGQVSGSWTWAEAAYAESLGCEVLVDECYSPTGEVDLFSRWWTVAATGRALPGNAARLAKAAANSLWGLFGMRGDDTESIRWADDSGTKPLRVELADRQLPHAWTAHIAAETASRVRVRMLAEIYDRADRGTPVHIDTDGMIIRRSAVSDMPDTAEPGEFRRKTKMKWADIRAPQVYRYACPHNCGTMHPGPHYSVAGVPAAAAQRIFDKVGRLGCSISFTGTDLVLPAHNAQDLDGRKAAVLEARSVMGLMS